MIKADLAILDRLRSNLTRLVRAYTEGLVRIPIILHPLALLGDQPLGRLASCSQGFVLPVHLGADIPQHSVDTALLNSCRALSTVVITTGKNIRLEKQWRPGFIGNREQIELAKAFRKNWYGDLGEYEHQVIALTHHANPNEMPSSVTWKELGVLDALKQQFKANEDAIFCLEAGPSTSLDLYSRESINFECKVILVASICRLPENRRSSMPIHWRSIKPMIDLDRLSQCRKLQLKHVEDLPSLSQDLEAWQFRIYAN